MRSITWKKSIKIQLVISFLFPFLVFSLVLFGFVRYVSDYIIQEHVIPQFDERLTENGRLLTEMLDPNLIKNTIDFPKTYGPELKRDLDSFIERKKESSMYTYYQEKMARMSLWL